VIGYFITGTDTDVGKTYVGCALARRALAIGRKVFAFKPIESGCARGADGEYIGADQEQMVAAAGGWQRGPLRGLYRLPLAAAPLVAAEAAGLSIDVASVVQTVAGAIADSQPDVVLVEGAGGWRVPITSDADMSVLARDLAFPVVVVARAGLGTINHTLLTVEAVQRDGLQVAAVVMSRRPADNPEATERNQQEIQRCWGGSVYILGDVAELDPLLQG
jgi:dethiobiotin synthetase